MREYAARTGDPIFMATEGVWKLVRVSDGPGDEGGEELTRNKVICIISGTKGELADKSQPGKKPQAE